MAGALRELNRKLERLSVQISFGNITSDGAGDAAWLESVEECLERQQGDAIASIRNEPKLTLAEANASVERLKTACDAKGWTLTPLITCEDEDDLAITCLIRRRVDPLDFVEVRVATVGNVDSGKSTCLGVLTHDKIDNGRGLARSWILRHQHERDNGQTSSVTHNVLGFDDTGSPVNKPSHQNVLDWADICTRATKVITFVDLAGHEKYLGTTTFGLTGHRPDTVMMLVGANAGLQDMTKEHMRLAISLGLPMIIVITKIDSAPEQVRERTVKHIRKVLQSPGCLQTPIDVTNIPSAIVAYHGFHGGGVTPIFQISNVTGAGVDLVKFFLNLLVPMRMNLDDKPLRFDVDDTFAVPGIGTVVSGSVIRGTVRRDDIVLLGPDTSGEFVPVQIRSIHRHRLAVSEVRSNDMATLALRKIARKDVRRGTVLIDKSGPAPQSAWQIEIQMIVLHHPSTIYEHYQTSLHCGCVRQTCKIVSIHKEGMGPDERPSMRSGDTARVRLTFIKQPEYLEPGMRVVMREGKAKAVGVVLSVHPEAPPYDRSKRRQRLRTKGNVVEGSSRRQRRKARRAAEMEPLLPDPQ